MTTAGLVLGSPAYIAPEIAAGQPVTPAADLWGLGATLFAAVEGRPPYDVRGDPVSTITEVVDGEVPRPTAAGPVAEVIAALMVKDPAQRMALGEVRRRLRPLIGDPDDPLYPGSPDAPTMAATYRVTPSRSSGIAGSGGSGPAGGGPARRRKPPRDGAPARCPEPVPRRPCRRRRSRPPPARCPRACAPSRQPAESDRSRAPSPAGRVARRRRPTTSRPRSGRPPARRRGCPPWVWWPPAPPWCSPASRAAGR